MRHSTVPPEVALSEVMKNGSSLSPGHYRRVDLPNKNFKLLKDLIAPPIRGKDQEARDFLNNSPYYYLKTKALRDDQFLIETFENGCLEYLRPQAFLRSITKSRKLKAGDILYCSSGGEEIGEAAMVTELGPQVIYSSHSFKLAILNKDLKFYVLSFLKSKFCKEQLSFLVYKGATLRRGGDKFLRLKIPFPNSDASRVITYLSLLAEAAITKESEIRRKHELILQIIKTELENNQRSDVFRYDFPSAAEVKAANRLDTNLFRPYFKINEFLIKNYTNGFKSIEELDFGISRGQNLQLSAIGDSVYTDTYYPNFYTLMLPKHLSRYGTVEQIEYLGNKNQLKTLNEGDLIFGAEGFEKGRSIVVTEASIRTITNIHGLTLHQKHGDLRLSIFVKCFLDYLRNIGLIDLYAVGGNGGSLGLKYWDIIPFPSFPSSKQEEIAKLYHNPCASRPVEGLTIENFAELDRTFNKVAGIVQLHKTAREIKRRINDTIDLIVRDEPVTLDFSFR